MKVDQRIEHADVHELRDTFNGRILLPDDDGYDETRKVWNALIDRRPSAILRAADRADVVRAVRFARERALAVTVRGGGHNVAGLAIADGAVMIDLADMRGVDVDAEARTATVQGGALWGDVDGATSVHGLHVTGGHVSSTGVGGLTLGGGIGWLHRKHGLTSDNLLSAEIVTADGEIVVASDTDNEELFWALRGGGGNFGVATSFTFRLHPVDVILGGFLLFPRDRAKELIEAYDRFVDGCPDELTTSLMMTAAPEEDPIPAQLQGQQTVQIVVVHCGDLDDAERAVKPLRDLGPAADLVQPMPYTAIQTAFDEGFGAGQLVYWKSANLNALDGAVDSIVDTDAFATVLMNMGGAIATLPEDATAFSQRRARYTYISIGLTNDAGDVETQKSNVRTAFDTVEPYTSGAYVNFLGVDEARGGASTAYSDAHRERLARIKKSYDPDNFFSVNTNIVPA
jgi:FAD/FMN-containing dehydrogenase